MATAAPFLEKQESQYSISTLDSTDDQSNIGEYADITTLWFYNGTSVLHISPRAYIAIDT